MSDLGNLWFSLGLDDSKFKAEWDAALAKYGKEQKININVDLKGVEGIVKYELIANKASLLQQRVATETERTALAQQKATTEAARTAIKYEKAVTQQQRTRTETERTALAQEKLANAKERVILGAKTHNMELSTSNRLMQNMHTLAKNYVSVFAARALLTNLIRVSGEFELQHTTLRAILQDINGADTIFNKIKSLSVESPFQFKDLISYTKQLSAFSVPMGELYDTTKMLADISAGLGVGMDRLTLAYGQIRSASFLRGTEVRQLTEAGVPILEDLAKQFTEIEGKAVSVGDVFDKISSRLVPFEMVSKVFKDMTSEGGKFYKMQEVQAETLKGKVSNLVDAYQIMYAEIGQKGDSILKGGVDTIRKLIDNYDKVGKEIIALVATYGLYRVALIASSNATALYAHRTTLLARAHVILNASLSKVPINTYVAIAAGVAALGYAIYKVSTQTTVLQRMTEEASKAASQFNAEVSSETTNLDYLFGRLKKLTVGTDEYNSVKNQILQQYRTYLSEVDKEKLKVGELASVYDTLKQSIIDANKEKFLQEGLVNIKKEYTDSYEKIFDFFDKNINKLGIKDKGTKQALGDYVRGLIGLEELPKEAKDAIDKVNKAKELTDKASRKGAGVLPSAYKLSFEEIREDITKIASDTEAARAKLEENLEIQFGVVKLDVKPIDKSWEELNSKVQKIIDSNPLLISFKVDKNDNYEKYLAKIQDGYEELQKKVKSFTGTTLESGKKTLETTKAQIKGLREIASSLGYNIEDKSQEKDDKKNEKDAKKTLDLKIKSLQEQVKWIDRLKASYQSLEPYYSDEQLSTVLNQLFPDFSNNIPDVVVPDGLLSGFDVALENLAKQLEVTGESAGISAAEGIRRGLVKDNAKILEGSLELRKKIEEELQKWLGEDFNFEGMGIEFDISKIVADLNSANEKVNLEAKKLQEDLIKARSKDEAIISGLKIKYGEDWEQEVSRQIEDLASKEIAANKKVAQEKINNLATKYTNEKLSESGLDLALQNLSEKTLIQLQTAKNNLQELLRQPIIIDEATLKQLDKAGFTIDNLSLKIKSVFQGKIKNISKEQIQGLASAASSAADFVSGLASQIKQLADELGDDRLSEGMDALSSVLSNFSAFAKGFAQGGLIGGIISGAANLIEQAIDSFVQSQIYIKKVNDAIYSFEESIRKAAIEAKILGKDLDSIFGENKIAKLQSDMQAAKDAMDAYKKSVSEVKSNEDALFGGEKKKPWWQGLGTIAFLPSQALENNIARYAANIKGLSSGYKTYLEGLEKGYSDIEAIAIKTKSRSGFAKLFGAEDEYMSLKDFAPDLFNEDGSVKMENIQAFLDANTEVLSDSQKKLFQQLSDNYQLYEDAMADVANYLKSIFGDVADTIADKMIDAFLQTGSAAVELGDIISNVGKKMVKDLISSILLEKVFKPYMDKIGSMYDIQSKDYVDDPVQRVKDAMAQLTAGMGAVNEITPEIQSLLEYMQKMGYVSESTAENAKDQIQGITEQTANRGINLINGIRADISSLTKGVIVSIIPTVSNINDNFTLAITIWKNIENNTKRSADNSDKIVGKMSDLFDKIDSMTGTHPNGGIALKVDI